MYIKAKKKGSGKGKDDDAEEAEGDDEDGEARTLVDPVWSLIGTDTAWGFVNKMMDNYLQRSIAGLPKAGTNGVDKVYEMLYHDFKALHECASSQQIFRKSQMRRSSAGGKAMPRALRCQSLMCRNFVSCGSACCAAARAHGPNALVLVVEGWGVGDPADVEKKETLKTLHASAATAAATGCDKTARPAAAAAAAIQHQR